MQNDVRSAAQSTNASGSDLQRCLILGASLVAMTLAAYYPVLSGKFLWDDDSWTSRLAPLFANASGLLKIWTTPAVLQQYYPLAATTFWVDHQLWGEWTLPYHLENVLLHATSTVLFWRLLRNLEVPGAWLAGAIFALHPVMVESVAWVTERKNTLSLVCYLGSLLAYGYFCGFWKPDPPGTAADTGSPARRKQLYAVAFLLFASAMLAKTTAFSLPAVLLLLRWWKSGRIRWLADVCPAIPFFILSLILGLVTAWVEKHHVGAQGANWELSLAQRCLLVGPILWFYVGKLLWPAHLNFVYEHWNPDPASAVQWLYSLSALGAILGLWGIRKWVGRGPATAALFFAGTLFPVLGLLNAYFMRYSYVCDHWTYLSSLGLIALFAALIAQLGQRLGSPRLSPVFAIILLPILGGLTWRHSADFLDNETLWRTTLARNPDAGVAYFNLGRELSRQGRFAEAVTNYQQTLMRVQGESDVHFDLANALLQLGRLDEAIFQYRKTLELQQIAPDAELNLGVALTRQGKISEAAEHLKKSLSEWPASTEALKNLALAVWLMATSPDPAIRNPEYAVILASDLSAFTHQTNARIWRTLARAQASSGQFVEAADSAGRGLQLALQHNDKQAAEALTTDLNSYRQKLTNKVSGAP